MGYIPLKPTIVNGLVVLGQNLAVGSSTASFTTFNSNTNVVAIQVLGNNLQCTLDGTGPSGTNGATLYAGQTYHWDTQTAQRAQFIQGNNGSGSIYAQECVNATTASDMPLDMSIWKPVVSIGGGSGSGFANPMTTQGDIIYGATSGTPVRLGGVTGSATMYLASQGTGSGATAPFWATVSGGSGSSTNVMTSIGDMIFGSSSGSQTRLAATTASHTRYLTETGTGSAGAQPIWKDGPVFNVKDYGAKGDGSTDDTTALQAALTLAANANGTWYAPSSDYVFSAPLTLPSNYTGRVALKGDSRNTSRLLYSSTGNGLYFDLTHGTWAFANAVDVSDLALLANAPGGGSGVTSGYAISFLYPVGSSVADETRPGCSVHRCYIAPLMAGNYAANYAHAGWNQGIYGQTACHLSLDDIFIWGSGDWPNSGQAGNGCAIVLESGVNSTIANIVGGGWNNGIRFLNSGGSGALDCQGIFMDRIEMVGVNQFISSVGTGSFGPLTITNWQIDNGFSGGTSYSQMFTFNSCQDIRIGEGLGILGTNSPANGVAFVNCQRCSVVGADITCSGSSSYAVVLSNYCDQIVVDSCNLQGQSYDVVVGGGCTRTMIGKNTSYNRPWPLVADSSATCPTWTYGNTYYYGQYVFASDTHNYVLSVSSLYSTVTPQSDPTNWTRAYTFPGTFNDGPRGMGVQATITSTQAVSSNTENDVTWTSVLYDDGDQQGFWGGTRTGKSGNGIFIYPPADAKRVRFNGVIRWDGSVSTAGSRFCKLKGASGNIYGGDSGPASDFTVTDQTFDSGVLDLASIGGATGFYVTVQQDSGSTINLLANCTLCMTIER